MSVIASRTGRSVVRLGQENPVYGVLVHVYPRLMTVREDRELLRLLRSYGEITSFFNRKNTWPVPAPNKYLVTFKNSEDASSLMRSTPLEFSFSHVDEETENPLAKVISDQAKANPDELEGLDEPQNMSSHPAAPSQYILRSELSAENHMAILQRQPYWGGFNPSTRKAEFQDLVQTVPNVGLADITSIRGPDVNSEKVGLRRELLQQRLTLRDLITRHHAKRAVPAVPAETS